ncbi:hypothetical protein HPB51_014551 [Rhipicephalus microplus]|nr:hypothetical protein HPB51_014551 [Rhipicephalus microplus]
MCDVSWDLEPDCWGSDHHPLKIGLAAYNQRRLRRRCYTTNWDLFRNELNDSIADTSSDPLQVLTRAVQAATQSSWVEENRPHPNLHLLRLWAARRRAELALNRDPAAAELRDNLNRLTAAARRCEKRLARERWMDWCASLGPSSSTASIWRTFRSMELGTRTPDPAASACLSSGCTPSQFAPEIVKAFFPAYNLAPPQFDCPCNLPPEVGVTPSPSDIEGMQAPYTMAELQAAIDQAKSQAVPAAAALAHYYGSTLPQPDAPVAEVPPWLKAQASDNRPLTRLRQSTRQAAQEGIVTTTENSLAVYVDAATDNCVLHTSLVCPAQPEIQHICSYVTEAPFPSVLAELTAIRDGLTVMISKMDSLSHDKLLVYTDSTQAVRELRKVTSSIDIASDIHRLIHSCACPVRVLWTRRSAPAQVEADAACHPATVQHPLPLLRLSPKDSLLVHKETLRRSTRALIPPRGSDLPGGLTRREEVALRRIRVGAALTPAIRATWTSGAQPPPTTCPFCVAPATEATLDHLLGTCPGLHQARTRHLRGLHHHPGRPPDLTRWTHGPLHRQLLAFIQETKLFLFI